MIERLLRVSLTEQRLDVVENSRVVKSYAVSTSKHGAGELAGSFKTPRGRHVVRARIGAGQPFGAVFVARRPTSEIYSEELRRAQPDHDWILSRILWLSGTEFGKNRLGNVDSMRRYIYIHGTPDSEPLGEPRSIGCIRMSNADVIELFDLIAVGTPVEISE